MPELITDAEMCANDAVMADCVLQVLDQHYPNHQWWVDVRGKHGILIVKHAFLDGMKGFVIKLTAVYSASDLVNKVRTAGGELLERYNVKRGPADQEALVHLPTDFAGRHVAATD